MLVQVTAAAGEDQWTAKRGVAAVCLWVEWRRVGWPDFAVRKIGLSDVAMYIVGSLRSPVHDGRARFQMQNDWDCDIAMIMESYHLKDRIFAG